MKVGNPQISRYHCCGFQVISGVLKLGTWISGYEFLHHLGWKSRNRGMFTTYQLVIGISSAVPYRTFKESSTHQTLRGREIFWLVVWTCLEHGFFDFPYIGNCNPNWRTPSFFRWVGQPPTSLCKIAWSLCCFMVYISVPIPRAEMLIGILIGWYWIILDVI